MQIKGQIALVTGANRGLGRAIAKALVEAGAAKVYAAARDPKSVDLPSVQPIRLDLTDPASIEAAGHAASDVTLLVNNAGIFQSGSIFGPQGAAALRDQLETNLFGTLNVTNAFAPALARNGGGAIVNILSVLSWLTIDGSGAYSASKAATWALTNGFRKELSGKGTEVLAVHVGYMDTDMTAGLNVPKSDPADVAHKILAALEEGKKELMADGITQSVKDGLSAVEASYL